jgi:hypothetical protein
LPLMTIRNISTVALTVTGETWISPER